MLRRWRHDGHEVHHLLDPETGRPLDTGVAAITVVAGEGWWAEVMAKAAFAAGVDRAPSVLVNAAALLVDMSGGRHATPGFEEVAA
jgi:thiamine biosynthesis lipoprotein